MDFRDKVIACLECKKEFTHTVDDQKRFAERGFYQEPKRCPDCRQARKDRVAAKKANPRPSQDVGASGDFGGGFGAPRREGRGGGGFGGGRGGGRSSERGGRMGGGGFGGGGFGGGVPRQSFDAVCAACGVKTTVPFEPTQGREVFCRDCFKKKRGET